MTSQNHGDVLRINRDSYDHTTSTTFPLSGIFETDEISDAFPRIQLKNDSGNQSFAKHVMNLHNIWRSSIHIVLYGTICWQFNLFAAIALESSTLSQDCIPTQLQKLYVTTIRTTLHTLLRGQQRLPHLERGAYPTANSFVISLIIMRCARVNQ